MFKKQFILLKYLNEKNSVHLNQNLENSTQAIDFCLNNLVANKNCTEEYVEHVKAELEIDFQDCIIGNGVAVLSSNSTKGILKEGISLVTLNQPVKICDQEISLLVGIAVFKNRIELERFYDQIALIFDDKNKVRQMLLQTSNAEFLELVNKILVNKYV